MLIQIVNYKVITLKKKIWCDCALFLFPITSYLGSPSVGLDLEVGAERIGWFELTQSFFPLIAMCLPPFPVFGMNRGKENTHLQGRRA